MQGTFDDIAVEPAMHDEIGTAARYRTTQNARTIDAGAACGVRKARRMYPR
jgi:hypothetical protein